MPKYGLAFAQVADPGSSREWAGEARSYSRTGVEYRTSAVFSVQFLYRSSGSRATGLARDL
jgi:hypothetical protein